MGKNKTIRKELRDIYGKGCMFERARISERIEKMGGIKTYKKYKKEKHYTANKVKQLEKIITLHHLKHRSEGGQTTTDNGANISVLAHEYIHSLPREQEEIINQLILEWKIKNSKKIPVELVDDLDLGYEVKAMELVLERQRELQEDLENEFNERNAGGYGR